MGINLLNDVSVTGALTIQDSLSSPDPLLTLYNDTNGGGSTILFSDQANTQAQKGRLIFYHSDGASVGGGASFHFNSTEDDLVLAVGDADATHGRIAVWSGGSSAEADYCFAQDVNTGMRRIGADNVGLIGGGVTGVSVSGTTSSISYAGSTKLATTSIGIDVTGDVTLSNGNALRWTSDDVRIEGTTAGDKIQFYVGNSEILRLEQSGPLSTFTSNLAVTGGDLSLASGFSVLSNATSASTLNIGDISGSDEITLINFKTYGNIAMAIDDDLVTVSAAEFSIGSTTAVTFGTDSHIVYSHAGSSTGLANGNTIKLGSSVTTAGLVYYLSSSTTWATAANTSSNSTKMLGVATGTSSSSGMLLQGVFTKATHGFTIGAPLYISSSGGSLTTTVPTASNSYARVVGYAVDTNNIYFCPDNTWVQNK